MPPRRQTVTLVVIAISLLVIFILLVLSAGLWILQSYANEDNQDSQENFITDQTFASQKRFIDENIAKAKVGDATIDVFYPPYPDDLKRATEDIDLFAQRQRPATEKWYSNVYSAEILKKEKKFNTLDKYPLPSILKDDITINIFELFNKYKYDEIIKLLNNMI